MSEIQANFAGSGTPSALGSDSNINNAASYPAHPAPTMDPTSSDYNNIHNQLRLLRLDEIVTLAQDTNAGRIAKEKKSWWMWFINPIRRYLVYLLSTWTDIGIITLRHTLSPKDWAYSVLFASVTSTVLLLVLPFTQLANNPAVNSIYWWVSDRYFCMLGLVNAANPALFNALTEKETLAAKHALSQRVDPDQDNEQQRTFNLDIAKLLLQCAAVMYERENIVILSTIGTIMSTSPEKPVMSAAASSSRSSIPKGPETAPTLVAPIGQLVRESYSPEMANTIEAEYRRTFVATPSGHEEKDRGTKKGDGGDTAVGKFVRRMGLEYEPVSELGSATSAFCAFFWDARQNWILISFKGTSPTEYSDWVTDLTTMFIDVNDFLPGYGKAIKGFKNRIYPGYVPPFGETRPWDTVRLALRKLSHELRGNSNDGKVNVWFTGHSLGSSLAQLAFARSINSPEDFAGTGIEIRDAYCFAAPVVANRQCLLSFNTKMLDGGDHPQTLWRVTNDHDAVATALPDGGDRNDLDPDDPAGFSHLGVEFHMIDGPKISTLNNTSSGSLFGGINTIVNIRSQFTPEQIEEARKQVLKQPGDKFREGLYRLAERIPVIGRLVAHGTVLYWDQLDRIILGETKWVAE